MSEMIVELTRAKKIREERKRACINCGHRIIDGASDFCERDNMWIPYWDLWDYWCKHWCKSGASRGAR